MSTVLPLALGPDGSVALLRALVHQRRRRVRRAGAMLQPRLPLVVPACVDIALVEVGVDRRHPLRRPIGELVRPIDVAHAAVVPLADAAVPHRHAAAVGAPPLRPRSRTAVAASIPPVRPPSSTAAAVASPAAAAAGDSCAPTPSIALTILNVCKRYPQLLVGPSRPRPAPAFPPVPVAALVNTPVGAAATTAPPCAAADADAARCVGLAAVAMLPVHLGLGLSLATEKYSH